MQIEFLDLQKVKIYTDGLRQFLKLNKSDVISSVCLEGNEPVECDQFTALGNCEKCTHFNKQTVL